MNGTGPSAPVTWTVPSSSTIGSRRRAAASASPSRVCAFSRARNSSRAVCQASQSTTDGRPDRLVVVGVSVTVSSSIGGGAVGAPAHTDDGRRPYSSMPGGQDRFTPLFVALTGVPKDTQAGYAAGASSGLWLLVVEAQERSG